MAKTLETRLDKFPNSMLADAYNAVSERKITKFSDHATAVKRTLAAFEAAGKDIVVRENGVFDIVDAGTARTGGREGDDRAITVLAETNPKVKGTKSHARFALYGKCRTVGDYIAAASKMGGGRRKAVRDLTWDVAHGYIRLG